MKLVLEAQGEVKFLKGNDFEELKQNLHKLSQKYGFNVEIKNFKVDYKKE
jgi:hypothetical protein